MDKKQCSSCHWWLRDNGASPAHWGACTWGQHHLPQFYVDTDAGMRENDGDSCATWRAVGKEAT
jgi:hypothetical protein